MERKNRLLEIDKKAGEQLVLIALKIQKIHAVQTDLENMRIRVQMAIAEIEVERK
jgi:hypothetical protein